VAERIQLGGAALARVLEWQVDGLTPRLFPQTPADAWQEVGAEYTPTFWSDTGWRIALQTWVVEVDGLTEASRTRAAVIPAHYPGHGGATVVARGDAFIIDQWLDLPSI
jgi:hypothetical protein